MQARSFRVALYLWAAAHRERYLAVTAFAAFKPGQSVLAPDIGGAVGMETIQIARRIARHSDEEEPIVIK